VFHGGITINTQATPSFPREEVVHNWAMVVWDLNFMTFYILGIWWLMIVNRG
jgi:hypothetical protein